MTSQITELSLIKQRDDLNLLTSTSASSTVSITSVVTISTAWLLRRYLMVYPMRYPVPVLVGSAVGFVKRYARVCGVFYYVQTNLFPMNRNVRPTFNQSIHSKWNIVVLKRAAGRSLSCSISTNLFTDTYVWCSRFRRRQRVICEFSACLVL